MPNVAPGSNPVAPGRLVLGDGVDAVTMPSGVAAQVDAFLTVRLMRAPILGVDGDVEWTLLTGPRMPLRPSIQEELALVGIRFAPVGTLFTVTDSCVGREGPRWWDGAAVVAGSLPPQSVVVAACRSVAGARRGGGRVR
ncbi:hypothetical protein [Actinoalloteichus hoggarensis]|nr:hypothetical protein [Actinoalloteichus hoggarensis]